MAFIFDLIDIKWFLDNFGDVLMKLIDSIGDILGGLFNKDDAPTE